MRRLSIATMALIWLLSTTAFSAHTDEILLWPHGAPGSAGQTGEASTRVTADGERVVSNVHKPSMTPYVPSADEATGTAVVIAPGGGHRELWTDHEGHNLAKWLRERGICA